MTLSLSTCLQSNMSADFLQTVIAFENGDEPFEEYMFSEPVTSTMHPVKWWKMVSKSCVMPLGFVDYVVSLHSACASSASIERIFSTFGFIHDKIRNRLGVEKAAKLVFCYRMLAGDHESDW